MSRRHRRKFDAGVQTGAEEIRPAFGPALARASPVLLLLASVPAVADEAVPPAPTLQALLAQAISGPARATASRDAASDKRLIVSLDPTAVNDSAFLRRLLLSHGIELDIGEHPNVSGTTLGAIRDAVRGEGNAEDGITLAQGDALEATLLIDVAELLARYPSSRVDDEARMRTHYFRLPGTVALAALDESEFTAFDGADACKIDPDLLDQLRARGDGPIDEDLALELWAGFERPQATSDSLRATHLAGVSRRWRTRWIDCGDLSRPTPIALGDPLRLDRPTASGQAPSAASTTPAPDTEGDTSAIDRIPDAQPAATPDRLSQPPFGAAIGMSSDEPTGVQRAMPGRKTLAVGDEVPPPGFEGLLGPIAHAVDLRFNERTLGTVFITVTADEFTFDDPARVLDLLEGVERPDELLPLVSESLPTNAAQRCFARDDPTGCGILEVSATGTPFAALFDEYELSLDVFVAPEWQNTADEGEVRYLEPPTTRGTSVLSLGAVATEVESSGQSLDLYVRGIAGVGRGNIRVGVDHDADQQRTRLRELLFTHYLDGYELGIGQFAFSPGAGLQDVDIVGTGLSTSYRTRLDLDRAFGTPLVVYLPRRSIVQLVVDDRVLAGDSYPAGNQELDTGALPDGTYEIEIRVLDGAGGESSETRVFSKNPQIPPRGEALIGITAGFPLDIDRDTSDDRPASAFFPERDDTAFAALSYARRWTDHSFWRGGLVQHGNRSSLQAEFAWFGTRLSVQTGATLGTGDRRASVTRAAMTLGGVAFGAGFLSSRGSDGQPDDHFYFDDFDQLELGISGALGRTQLGVRVNRRNEVNDAGDSTRYGAYARRPLFTRRNLRGSIGLDLQHSDDVTRIDLGVTFSLSRGRSSTSLFTGVGNISSKSGTRTSGAVTGIQTQYRSAPRETFRWNAGAHARERSGTSQAGVEAGVQNRWFNATGATDWQRTQEGDARRSSVASLRAQIGLDRDGAAIGSDEFAQSGVIVDIGGEPEGEAFDVEVNDLPAGVGRIGEARFFALPPFGNYRVRLLPRSLLSNGIGGEHRFTLFPGSVQRVDLTARREVLLIGSLVNERGQLIIDSVIEIENPALIDASGVFQAEVSPGDIVSVRHEDGRRCTFTVPGASDGEELLIPEAPIPCRAAG